MINIIHHNWDWARGLTRRLRTDAFVLHHSAGHGDAEAIHKLHLGNGWAGIGYHFYIRKDGTVDEGRPLWAAGGHTLNYNSTTIGICCEGNYDVETVMPMAQLTALRELLAYLKGLYPNAAIKCHRDYNATACPGKWFPLGEALKYNAPVTPAEREDEDMQRFNTVGELPEAYRADIQTLINKGLLRGKGDINHLDITEDMARTLIICGRMQGVLK